MAPQLIATKGRRARGLRSWIVRATSSLPQPDSPVMKTVASVGATRSIIRYTSCMDEDPP